jgi:hypothetical protein
VNLDTFPISNESLEPELSPLHNPILAEHLDQWARVYAAAAPESRTQALQQLLYDLKEKGASGQLTDMRPEELAPAWVAQPVEISCPQCGKIKEPGQKFCGFCGTEFGTAQDEDEPEAVAPRFTATARPSSVRSSSVSPSSEPALYPTRELDSLRELSFSTIYGADESSGNGWRYTIVTLVVLLCLGAIGYLQWHTQILAEWNKITAPNSAANAPQQANAPISNPETPSPQQAANAPAAQTPENPAPASPEPANAAAEKSAESPNPQGSDTQANNAPVNAAEKNSKPNDNVPHADSDNESESAAAAKLPSKEPITAAAKREPEDTSFVDNGSAELATAQNYLNGTYGSRNSAQAATWLWKAVSKQNSNALVLLSDLYARGDGVSKNCDQARLLLVAAAKKGAADAGPKLRNFEMNGCH